MPLKDNLVLCLELDEASGNRNDSHINNLDATDVNTVDSNTGILYSLAARFTETNNERLVVPYDAIFTQAQSRWSAATWVRITGAGAGNHNLAARHDTNDACWGWDYLNGELRFRIATTSTDTSTYAYKASAATTGVWYHLAVVYDGNGAANADRVKFYKDGAEISSLSFSGTIPSTLRQICVQDLVLGRFGTLRDAHQRMQQFAMWHRVLTTTDITELWSGGAGAKYSTWTITPRPKVGASMASRSPLLGGLVR